PALAPPPPRLRRLCPQVLLPRARSRARSPRASASTANAFQICAWFPPCCDGACALRLRSSYGLGLDYARNGRGRRRLLGNVRCRLGHRTAPQQRLLVAGTPGGLPSLPVVEITL